MFKRLLLSIFCSILLSFPTFAATLEAKIPQELGGETVITLTDDKCENPKILANIKPEYQSNFQSGSVSFPVESKVTPEGKLEHKNKKIALCWALNPQSPSNVFVIDEDGDFGEIPIIVFATKPDTI